MKSNQPNLGHRKVLRKSTLRRRRCRCHRTDRSQDRCLRKEPGEIIFREGEPGDSIYLVRQGSVKISKSADTAHQEILDYVDQGNFFGAVALLAGEPHSTTATAVQPALIGEVKEETFEELLNLAPSRLHLNFLRAVATRVHSANAY